MFDSDRSKKLQQKIDEILDLCRGNTTGQRFKFINIFF